VTANPKIQQLLFLVSPARRSLYESLRRTFEGDDTVHVILDRRVAERRRRQTRRRSPERRRAERRSHHEVDEQLRDRGYVVVGVLALRERQPAASRRSR